MSFRTASAAYFALSLGFFLAAPSRAAVEVSTQRFSLTFPDGWQNLSLPGGGDSTAFVMQMTYGASCILGTSYTEEPVTEDYIAQVVAAFAETDSTRKVSGGPKTLGGKAFAYLEYETTAEEGGTGRARIYYYAQGSTLFTTILLYDPAEGAAAVDEVESALGGLTVPIRPVARRIAAARGPATLDLLGRHAPRTPTRLFALPVR